jgi:hypothetical protein
MIKGHFDPSLSMSSSRQYLSRYVSYQSLVLLSHLSHDKDYKVLAPSELSIPNAFGAAGIPSME